MLQYSKRFGYFEKVECPMSKQLLIAEDSPELLEVLSEIVSGLGYVVSAVSDGQTAIDIIAENVPDIAMIDVNMPLASGYEVLDFLRHQPNGHHTKVILLTGDCRVNSTVEASLADVILTKPFDVNELLCLL